MPQADRAYHNILELFWESSFSQAADLAAKALESQEPHAAPERYYRAWIECIAELGDLSALKELRAHLGRRAHGQTSNWLALQGIISLELDEPAFGGLLHKFIKGGAYAAEFEGIRKLRSGKKLPNLSGQTVQELRQEEDYFVWRSLLNLRQLGTGKVPESFLDQVPQPWREQMTLELRLHHALDTLTSESFKSATISCQELAHRHPRNPRWRKLLIYLAAAQNRYPDAIETACLHPDIMQADIKAIIGLCHWRQTPKLETIQAQKSLEYYEEALADMKDTNQSTVDLELATQFLRSPSPVQKFAKVHPKHWLVPLEDRHCYEIQNTPEDQIDYLVRQAQKTMTPGDILYLGSRQEDTFMVVALYRVATIPVADPFIGWAVQSVLVRQFPRRIPTQVAGKIPGKTVQLPRAEGISLLKQLDEFCQERALPEVSVQMELELKAS